MQNNLTFSLGLFTRKSRSFACHICVPPPCSACPLLGQGLRHKLEKQAPYRVRLETA